MKVSLKEIAEECGYSKTLVSAVLGGRHGCNRCSEETRQKILFCAEKRGYTPNLLARAMVTGTSPAVLLSLHEPIYKDEDVIDFYLSDMLIQSARTLKEAGIYMLYMPYRNTEEQIEQIKEAVDSGMVCGVIANFVPGEEKELLLYLKERKLTSVILGIPEEPQEHICVDVDYSLQNKMLHEYARRQDVKAWGQVFIHERSGTLAILNAEHLPDSPFLDPDALFFASGIRCFRQLKIEQPHLKNIVLLEDIRFHLDHMTPAIQIRSIQPRVIERACSILLEWKKTKRKPEHKITLLPVKKTDIFIQENKGVHL